MATDEGQRDPVVSLVTSRPDAEIAADFKVRMQEAMNPVLAIFDEAIVAGMIIQMDGIAAVPPLFKHQLLGLRVVKHL